MKVFGMLCSYSVSWSNHNEDVFNRMSGLPQALDCIVSLLLIWVGKSKSSI